MKQILTLQCNTAHEMENGKVRKNIIRYAYWLVLLLVTFIISFVVGD
jgi:fumarate reductase subunit C